MWIRLDECTGLFVFALRTCSKIYVLKLWLQHEINRPPSREREREKDREHILFVLRTCLKKGTFSHDVLSIQINLPLPERERERERQRERESKRPIYQRQKLEDVSLVGKRMQKYFKVYAVRLLSITSFVRRPRNPNTKIKIDY